MLRMNFKCFSILVSCFRELAMLLVSHIDRSRFLVKLQVVIVMYRCFLVPGTGKYLRARAS